VAGTATSGPSGNASRPLGIGGTIAVITTTSGAEGVDHGVRMKLEGLVATGKDIGGLNQESLRPQTVARRLGTDDTKDLPSCGPSLAADLGAHVAATEDK
jgi:hypothetical protein